jgi:hypothetical protein
MDVEKEQALVQEPSESAEAAAKPAVPKKKAKKPPARLPTKKRAGRKAVGASRPFPASSFEEALTFAREVFNLGSGQPVRRLTVFDHLGKAPESSASRMLITNSGRYGLTKGSYVAEQLEITPEGRKAVDEGVPKREQIGARIRLAILDIPSFQKLYERFTNSKLPAKAVLIDAIKYVGVPAEFAEECRYVYRKPSTPRPFANARRSRPNRFDRAPTRRDSSGDKHRYVFNARRPRGHHTGARDL